MSAWKTKKLKQSPGKVEERIRRGQAVAGKMKSLSLRESSDPVLTDLRSRGSVPHTKMLVYHFSRRHLSQQEDVTKAHFYSLSQVFPTTWGFLFLDLSHPGSYALVFLKLLSTVILLTRRYTEMTGNVCWALSALSPLPRLTHFIPALLFFFL